MGTELADINGERLERALWYRSAGLNPIPVGNDKKPLVRWEDYQTRLVTEARIHLWWGKEFPGACIAVITGSLSGICVVDCDSPEAEAKVIELVGNVEGIPRVRTPRGGCHFCFRYEPGMTSRTGFLPQTDFKAQGGYIVVPPSIIEKGAYVLEAGSLDAELPEMPPALKNLLSTNGRGYQPPEGPPLVKGHRNDELFHLARGYFKDGLNVDEVYRVISRGAKTCIPPLPDEEAVAIVNSAWEFCKKQREEKENSHLLTVGEDALSLVRRKCSDIEDIPILWLWKGVAAMATVTAITGEPGIAKTFVAVDIAARVTSGTRFPAYCGEAPPITGSVLYICSEGLPESILKPRLRAAGADLRKVDIVEAIQDTEGKILQFDVTKHLPLIERAIAQSRDLRLVVIDPIASFLPPKISDIASTQVRHAMDHISAFAAKTRIAVLTNMHFNKDLTQKAISRTSGSVQFMAAVKSSWAVVHRKGDPDNRRLLVPQKSNIFRTEQSLPFSIEDYTYEAPRGRIDTARIRYEAPIRVNVDEVVSPQTEPTISKTAAARQFLREHLRDGRKGQRELRELAEEQGIAKHALWRAKEDLHVVDERDGYQGRSYWRLPQPDEEASG